MAFYGAILRDRPLWSLGAMRGRGLPVEIEPRWSRLVPRLPRLPGLGPAHRPAPGHRPSAIGETLPDAIEISERRAGPP